MVGIAQLVRAPDCDSGGRGFESRYSPLGSVRTYVVSGLFLFWQPDILHPSLNQLVRNSVRQAVLDSSPVRRADTFKPSFVCGGLRRPLLFRLCALSCQAESVDCACGCASLKPRQKRNGAGLFRHDNVITRWIHSQVRQEHYLRSVLDWRDCVLPRVCLKTVSATRRT